MDKIINQVREFADNAHGSQTRKYTPERYIVHPVRVMETLRNYDSSLPVLAAALLHDVLEDTPVSRSELLLFLRTIMEHTDAEKTVLLVEELTDVYVKTDYPQWNRNQRKAKELERIAKTSAKAQTIKYADIIDNTNEITVKDPGFAPRYLRECMQILQVADKGDKDLYRIAKEGIKAGLDKIKKQGPP
jgi:guanosine-3',5'-bis(diphosphate) 3'-pyrophosphohydrolase